MPNSHGGRPARSFALTRWQRLRFSVGTPLRATGFVIFVAALSWLGYVSIGVSAVIVIAAIVFVVHWVPYAFAGRHRIMLNDAGVVDHVRFRTRTYAWSEIDSVRPVPLPAAGFGLVLHMGGDRAGGGAADAFLRASWRPDRVSAERLAAAVRTAGGLVADEARPRVPEA